MIDLLPGAPLLSSWLDKLSRPDREAIELLATGCFANIYGHFIHDYSKLAAPLTRLISTLRPFMWSVEAAFSRLKKLFNSVDIRLHPDNANQFIMEVDATDIGVREVISQQHQANKKLNPCAFFSLQLSPGVRNCVGSHEFLVLVLALQEWQHWLEGSAQPFVVWTDHKDPAGDRQSAKRLSARQP